MRSRSETNVVSAGGTSYTTNESSEKKLGGMLGFGFRRGPSNVVKTLDFPVFATNPVSVPRLFSVELRILNVTWIASAQTVSIGTATTTTNQQTTRRSEEECSLDTAAMDAHGGCSKISHSMEFADANDVA